MYTRLFVVWKGKRAHQYYNQDDHLSNFTHLPAFALVLDGRTVSNFPA